MVCGAMGMVMEALIWMVNFRHLGMLCISYQTLCQFFLTKASRGEIGAGVDAKQIHGHATRVSTFLIWKVFLSTVVL